MPTVEASGSLAMDGSEQTAASIATNRSLISFVDLTNMQAGDTVVVRTKRKVLTGGALVEFEEETLTDVQDPELLAMSPISSPFQYDLTIEQTGGVNRTFDFSVESL